MSGLALTENLAQFLQPRRCSWRLWENLHSDAASSFVDFAGIEQLGAGSANADFLQNYRRRPRITNFNSNLRPGRPRIVGLVGNGIKPRLASRNSVFPSTMSNPGLPGCCSHRENRNYQGRGRNHVRACPTAEIHSPVPIGSFTRSDGARPAGRRSTLPDFSLAGR